MLQEKKTALRSIFFSLFEVLTVVRSLENNKNSANLITFNFLENRIFQSSKHLLSYFHNEKFFVYEKDYVHCGIIFCGTHGSVDNATVAELSWLLPRAPKVMIILENVKIIGTVTEYHDIEQYPNTTIVLAAFKEFELVALRHQGFSRDTREPKLLQNCSVFAIPYLKSQDQQNWIIIDKVKRVESVWASFMFFEGPKEWRNGFLHRVVCINPSSFISYLTYITPKPFDNFSAEWQKLCDEVDYDEGIGSARGSYTLLVDQSGIIPITVGSGTLTSIEMTRKETLVNEHLQDVEIVTLVSSTMLREERLFSTMSISYRWPDGHILKVKNIRGGSYYSLAFILCTVLLAMERSYAFFSRARGLNKKRKKTVKERSQLQEVNSISRGHHHRHADSPDMADTGFPSYKFTYGVN